MTIEQLESYTNVIGQTSVLLYIVFFYALWNIFYHSAKEKITIIAGCLLFIINTVLVLCLDLGWYKRLLICAVIVIAYSIVRYGERCEKAVFVYILYCALRCISWLSANSISQMITNFGIDRIVEKEGLPEDIMLFTFFSVIIFFVVMFSVSTVMILMLRRVIGNVDTINLYDACFLSFFNITAILFVSIIVKLNVVPLDNEVFVLYDNGVEFYWKFPLIAVLLFLGELTAIIVLQRYKEMQKREELYFAEQMQVKAMKLRLEEAEGFYDGIKSVKHEMKNHLMNINSLAADGKFDDVKEYISKLDVSMEKLEYKYSTGNALTDVIINDKYRQAENTGIKFDIAFSYKDIEGIDVFDIGIVLNNLLDNAITACEKVEDGNRFIKLTMQHKKKFIILEVENSFSDKVIFAENGMPVSIKISDDSENTVEHGIGLKNVKDIAERYFGTLNINVDGNTFKTTVLMQEKTLDKIENVQRKAEYDKAGLLHSVN